jgi:hypothetical protein
MNTLQRLASKIDGAAMPPIMEAAEILARTGDMEAACIPLLDVAFDVLGAGSRSQEIADLMVLAMSTQIVAYRDLSRRKPT